MKTVIRTLTFAIVAIAMMASCASPKKVAYFQDVANKDTVLQTAIAQALRIQKGDIRMRLVKHLIQKEKIQLRLDLILMLKEQGRKQQEHLSM